MNPPRRRATGGLHYPDNHADPRPIEDPEIDSAPTIEQLQQAWGTLAPDCPYAPEACENLEFGRRNALPMLMEFCDITWCAGAPDPFAEMRLAGNLLRGARRASRVCCFEAGTLVQTARGLRPIEHIEVGDLVLSRDEVTGETAYKPVVEVVPGHERILWRVTLVVDGLETAFGTTDDHPWRTSDGRWVTTDRLHEGQLILRAEGVPARVVSIVNTGETAITYNLEVADFHTYFVGEDRIWVHNCKFADLRDHFARHGAQLGYRTMAEYKAGAFRHVHTTTGQSIRTGWFGGHRNHHVTSLGTDRYMLTVANRSGTQVYTHFEVNSRYLMSNGIRLP